MRLDSILFCAGLIATGFSIPTNSPPTYPSSKVAYLLTTFPFEDEQIYMYLSEGNDPHSWNQLTLNGTNAPILRTTVGSLGVRDSFVIASPDECKFWIIATDLQVNAIEGDFNEATRFGSRSIVVWESSDLVNWSGPTLTDPIVSVQAGNAWAPEAYYDADIGAYLVIFAARFWPVEDTDRQGPQPPNKLMYVTTQDFKTFSEEKEFFYPGYPVIDATLLPAPEEGPRVWYRWIKDERDFLIYQERSETGILGEYSRVGGAPDEERIEFAAQYNNNEGPLIFKDNVSGTVTASIECPLTL